MKKIFFVTFLAMALTGCASTKSSIFSDYSLSGEYPLNYMDTAESKVGPNFKMDFIPRAYFDAWNSGWISCLTNQKTKERVAVVVRGNNVKQVIRKNEIDNLDYRCDVWRATSDSDWSERWSAYAKEFYKVKNDPTKNHLFGKYPEHPNIILKSYMFNVLHSPLNAVYKDLKVTKTYFTDSEDDYRLNYAYSIEVKINELDKSSKDDKKYLGFKTYHLLVKDNVVLEHLKSSF